MYQWKGQVRHAFLAIEEPLDSDSGLEDRAHTDYTIMSTSRVQRRAIQSLLFQRLTMFTACRPRLARNPLRHAWSG
jgi:hypothetical protein